MADINVSSPSAQETSDIRTAFQAILKNWRVIGASGVKVDRTGDTNETVMATIAIPAGALGANGILRISTAWSCTNNANNKTARLRLGGIGGTALMAPVLTTSGAYIQRTVHNRNSQSSQIISLGASSVNSFSTGTPATAAVDTSAALYVVITGQLATGTDTLSLESYLVEILYQA